MSSKVFWGSPHQTQLNAKETLPAKLDLILEKLVGVFRIDPEVTGKNPSPERLADLWAVPYAVHLDWSRRSPVFESAGAYAGDGFTLTGGDRPERYIGIRMDSGVFRSLEIEPKQHSPCRRLHSLSSCLPVQPSSSRATRR